MSHINLQAQSAPYTPSEPSKTGRLDVTWSGGIGSVDYGTITTKGGGRRSKSRRSKSHKSKRRYQTRKARRSKAKGSK